MKKTFIFILLIFAFYNAYSWDKTIKTSELVVGDSLVYYFFDSSYMHYSIIYNFKTTTKVLLSKDTINADSVSYKFKVKMEYGWVMSAGDPTNPPKEISFSENKTYYGWIGTPFNGIYTLGISINKEINLMVDTTGLIFYKTKNNSFGEKNTLFENILPFPTYVTSLEWEKFNIYPNPFIDRIQVDNSDQNQFDFKIWSLSGVMVSEQIIRANSLQIIDLSNLSSGVYVYRIYCNNVIKTGRLLKL